MLDESKTRVERINRKVKKKQRMVRVALGEEKADVVLKNATYVNVFSNELCRGDIAVAGGLVVGMGDYAGEVEYDVTGKIVVPGFIDAHIHLESSLVTPAEFARAVLPHGTTTVVADPHEIANVCGVKGIDYMIQATQGLPMDVHFMLPSCVPAAPVDESGAELSWRDINAYFDHPRVLGLAEMMNYPGVVAGDAAPIEKIVVSQAHHKKIDGHAPGLSGAQLNAYMSAGVYSDHECATLENALEKLRKGQFIMIREGTAAHNLEALMPLLTQQYASRCMFCSDDKHPADLIAHGHIDDIARRAVALGADPLLTVKVATHYAARYFLLNNKGAISPGYLADFAVLDDLQSFRVRLVFKRGELVWDGEQTHVADPEVDEELLRRVRDTFHMPPVTPQALCSDKPLPLIGMIPRQIVTKDLGHARGIDTEKDILKMAVAERHRNTGHLGVCYVQGYGLKRGAVATSIAHDSHNLIAVGASEADIALAMNQVQQTGGGMAVAADGRITAQLSLPVAGLMSDATLVQVNDALNAARAQAQRQGVNPGIDPFMTLSFMSLPVIPTLRLLTQGAFHVEQWRYVE